MLHDTVLLRTFAAICDAGSFTKAAREVNLTQSAVSLHVKRLEDQKEVIGVAGRVGLSVDRGECHAEGVGISPAKLRDIFGDLAAAYV